MDFRYLVERVKDSARLVFGRKPPPFYRTARYIACKEVQHFIGLDIYWVKCYFPNHKESRVYIKDKNEITLQVPIAVDEVVHVFSFKDNTCINVASYKDANFKSRFRI